MKAKLLTILFVATTFGSLGSAQANGVISATPVQVAEEFYSAFSKLDYRTMGALYNENTTAIFADPVFGFLNTSQARAMWEMLSLASLSYSKKTGVTPLQVKYEIAGVRGNKVHVRWGAEYTYSETGRFVRNYIETVMTVENGKIVNQRDQFDLCVWADMALGRPKSFACHMPFLIRSKSNKTLQAYMASKN